MDPKEGLILLAPLFSMIQACTTTSRLTVILHVSWRVMLWRAGLVQAVESYRLWLEGPGFESQSPRIAQARVRLATDTLPQTPHRAGALCTGSALLLFCLFTCDSISVQQLESTLLFFILLQLLLSNSLFYSAYCFLDAWSSSVFYVCLSFFQARWSHIRSYKEA